MKAKSLYFLLIFILVIASGCSQKPEEQIYNHLEEAVSLEKEYVDQQKPLMELEKEETKIYENILKLGMAEFDQITKLSDEALAIVSKREEMMKKEKTSIDASKKEFEKIKPIIEKLENEDSQKISNDMYQMMMKRYSTYEEMNKNYQTSIALDKELYNLFKKKDLTIDELDAQIDKINDSYNKVMELNKEFNDNTEAYNELKKKFYKTTDLKVEYKE